MIFNSFSITTKSFADSSQAQENEEHKIFAVKNVNIIPGWYLYGTTNLGQSDCDTEAYKAITSYTGCPGGHPVPLYLQIQ